MQVILTVIMASFHNCFFKCFKCLWHSFFKISQGYGTTAPFSTMFPQFSWRDLIFSLGGGGGGWGDGSYLVILADYHLFWKWWFCFALSTSKDKAKSWMILVWSGSMMSQFPPNRNCSLNDIFSEWGTPKQSDKVVLCWSFWVDSTLQAQNGCILCGLRIIIFHNM